MFVKAAFVCVGCSVPAACFSLSTVTPGLSSFTPPRRLHSPGNTNTRRPVRRGSSSSSSSSPPRMALVPMRVSELSSALVLGVPTGEQWGSYWGRTSKERYNAAFESVCVSFLGLWGSYFLSFVVGSPLATVTGTVAFFWFLLGPEWRAYQRNWELRGGRDFVDRDHDVDDDDDDDDPFWTGDVAGPDPGGLYGAFYFGSVSSVGVVEDARSSAEEVYPLADFDGYTMEDDDADTFHFPWKLRLRVRDNRGRALQVHARFSEDYLDLRPGMPMATVLLSTQRDFTTLDSMTDFFVPDANCWVGDYPYLNKDNFCQLLSRKKMMRLLEQERHHYDDQHQDDDGRGSSDE